MHIFRTPFPKNISGGLLLILGDLKYAELCYCCGECKDGEEGGNIIETVEENDYEELESANDSKADGSKKF